MKYYQIAVASFCLFIGTIYAASTRNLYIQGEEYLAFAEVMPAPVGGIEGIYKLITYPRAAIDAGVEGKVYILVFVNENGDVDDTKIIKGIGSGCDEEVIKAVKKSAFTPGKKEGKNVKVKLSLSILFKIAK